MNASIKLAYKQTRRDDDRNQPKAVQPWFTDRWRRKYYLIEGQEDTHFRIYRENDAKTADRNVWFSVAGNIEEAKALADKFETEMPGNQGKIIADKIRMAIPRWEAAEEKRRRKDYRLARKAAFARPEPGMSLYEGRTRGKRLRYTYDDNDDFEEESDATSGRRGGRDISGRSTPFEETRPLVTSSGRQVKSRLGGMYGESMLTDRRKEVERLRSTAAIEDTADEVIHGPNGRPVRSAIPTKRVAAARGRYAEGLESESETDEGAEPSGDEWSGNEDEPDDESDPELDDGQTSEDEIMANSEEDDENTQPSLVVQLRYRKAPPAVNETNGVNGINGIHSTSGLQTTNGHIGKSPLAQVQNAEHLNGPAAQTSESTTSDQSNTQSLEPWPSKTSMSNGIRPVPHHGEVPGAALADAQFAPAMPAVDTA